MLASNSLGDIGLWWAGWIGGNPDGAYPNDPNIPGDENAVIRADAWNRAVEHFSMLAGGTGPSRRIDFHENDEDFVVTPYYLGPYVKDSSHNLAGDEIQGEDYFMHDSGLVAYTGFNGTKYTTAGAPKYGARLFVPSFSQYVINLENSAAMDLVINRVMNSDELNGGTRSNRSNAAQDALIDGVFLDSLGGAPIDAPGPAAVTTDVSQNIDGTDCLRYRYGVRQFKVGDGPAGYVVGRAAHWNGTTGGGNSTVPMTSAEWMHLCVEFINMMRRALTGTAYLLINGYRDNNSYFTSGGGSNILNLAQNDGGIAETHIRAIGAVPSYRPAATKWVQDAILMPQGIRAANRTTTYDATCSTGTPNRILSTDARFDSEDVGTKITLQGAGASGGDYVGTITTIISATQVQVTPNIGTTVTAPTGLTRWRGLWRSKIAYTSGDYVAYENFGDRYKCILAVAAADGGNTTPPTDATHWVRIKKLTVRGIGKDFFGWTKMWPTPNIPVNDSNNLVMARFTAASSLLVNDGHCYVTYLPVSKSLRTIWDYRGGPGGNKTTPSPDLTGLGMPSESFTLRGTPTSPEAIQQRQFANGILKLNISAATTAGIAPYTAAVVTGGGGGVAPTAPSTLAQSGTPTPTSAAMTWAASTDTDGDFGGASALGRYSIERKIVGTDADFVVIKSNYLSTSTSFTNTFASAATSRTFQYKLRAYDEAGHASGYSNTLSITVPAAAVSDTTAPTTPGSVVAAQQAAAVAVTITWNKSTDAGSGVDDYTVNRVDTTDGGTTEVAIGNVDDTDVATVTTTDSDIVPGRSYKWVIRARDNAATPNVSAAGTSNTITIIEVVTEPPQFQTGARPVYHVIHDAPTGVLITWPAALPSESASVGSYRLTRTGGAAFTQKIVSHADGTNNYGYFDGSAADGIRYSYIVTPVSIDGNAGDPISTFLTVNYL